MFHKTLIVGNVGKDAEMRVTQSGKSVTSFSVGVQDGFGSNKKTVWFRVTAWEKLAETCNTYVKKGMLVLAEGNLQADDNGNPRVWNDKQGNAKASFELNAHTVRFLSSVEKQADPADPDLGNEDYF